MLTPRPAGTRWVHTHAFAGADLQRGMYTGQFGIVYIEAANEPGQFDQEVFLATHEWEPSLGGEEMGEEAETYPLGSVPKPSRPITAQWLRSRLSLVFHQRQVARRG